MRRMKSMFTALLSALFLLNANMAYSYEQKTTVNVSPRLSNGVSEKTLQNGSQVYPPSYAFVELLQRSNYITKPETQQYLQTYRAPHFRTLSPYYIVQRNGTSCSLATATMILNAVREVKTQSYLANPATQNEVLEMVNDPLWDNATIDAGPGVTLEQFARFLKEMFQAYQIDGVSVEAVYVKDKSPEMRKILHQDLMDLANEDKVTTFLALDFDDRTFIGANIDMGHISPVGGYDPKTGLVLILDVDREWTGPYWISEETVLQGLNTLDITEGLNEPTYRGYIRVQLQKNS